MAQHASSSFRRALTGVCLLLAAATQLPAADWIEYRSGPFHVFTDAGDKAGRERLTQLEQIRFVLGTLIGKPELTTIWPLNFVVFNNQKALAPHLLPKPIVEGGSSNLMAWSADTGTPRDLVRAIVELLLNDNSGRMPPEIETGLADLFSTIQVNATRVAIGAPLPAGELKGNRLRIWAKLQMLATRPEYSGKFRIYINNLQNAGEEDAAARNAFDVNAQKLNAAVDAYLMAGAFEAAPVSGKAVAPNRDFIEKNVDKPAVDALIAELDAKGKTFPPESPRGLLAKNTLPSLDLAAKANPKWAEPHFKMAALETGLAAQIGHLKQAAALDPRNAEYWQKLAETQAEANLFEDADKSWTAAERAARSPEERGRIHQAKLDLEDRRAQAVMDARRQRQEEEARELARVKNAAAEEVRAAERAANSRMAANAGNVQGAVPWFGDATGVKLFGMLTRVECAGPILKLTVQPETGMPVKVIVRDQKQLTVAADSQEPVFTCGIQKPTSRIEIQHNGKPDAKQGTAGDVVVLRVP